MFQVDERPLPSNGDYAAYRDSKTNDLYFARRSDQPLIDPLFVILANALEQDRSPGSVWVNYAPTETWKVAASGLRSLAASARPSGFAYTLQQAPPPTPGRTICVSLVGDAPPATQNVLTTGDIFTPNAHDFHNIPRLYSLAALTLEAKLGASVVALIVSASGQIVAKGVKSPGDGGCGHAEVRAIFSVKGQLPARWLLVSTLKPCNMCAGLIQALQGDSDRLCWARDDRSSGADYSNVEGLGPKNGVSLRANNGVNVRNIKLTSGRDFTSAFSTTWNDRDSRLSSAKSAESEKVKAAYATWCDKYAVAGRIFASGGSQIRFKAVDDLAAKAKGVGSAEALARRTDLFDRKKVSEAQWKPGLDQSSGAIVITAFHNSAEYREAFKDVRLAKAEADMGIIQYIAGGRGSLALRNAARVAFANKLVKYGKAQNEVSAAVGAAPTATVAGASTDPRMQPIADYLFEFVRAING